MKIARIWLRLAYRFTRRRLSAALRPRHGGDHTGPDDHGNNGLHFGSLVSHDRQMPGGRLF